jgi:hypothetical protein
MPAIRAFGEYMGLSSEIKSPRCNSVMYPVLCFVFSHRAIASRMIGNFESNSLTEVLTKFQLCVVARRKDEASK